MDEAIHTMGDRVDAALAAADVRLTMGGEPTFVSIDDMDGEQWNTGALGKDKRILSEQLIKALRDKWAPGGLLHYGQGKWVSRRIPATLGSGLLLAYGRQARLAG